MTRSFFKSSNICFVNIKANILFAIWTTPNIRMTASENLPIILANLGDYFFFNCIPIIARVIPIAEDSIVKKSIVIACA